MKSRDSSDPALITFASRSRTVSKRSIIAFFLSCDRFIQLHYESILFKKLIVMLFGLFSVFGWLFLVLGYGLVIYPVETILF